MPFWAPYVPVARRRANAKRQMEKLCKKGKTIEPVEIEGRTIAGASGQGLCDHLDRFPIREPFAARGAPSSQWFSMPSCHPAGHIEHRQRVFAVQRQYPHQEAQASPLGDRQRAVFRPDRFDAGVVAGQDVGSGDGRRDRPHAGAVSAAERNRAAMQLPRLGHDV